MNALALLAPVLVLGLLHVLQKLETWTLGESTPISKRRPAPLRAPLPRDPPPPPGYIDPLEEGGALDDLVAAGATEEISETATGSEQRAHQE